MTEQPEAPLHFTILFVAGLLLASCAVFFVFKHYAETSRAERIQTSLANLAGIRDALANYVRTHGANAWPERPRELLRERLLTPSGMQHPAWPYQPGYVMLGGVRAAEDPGTTMTVYENVPAAKRKLGHRVLLLNGEIKAMNEPDFESLLETQKRAWKSAGRTWQPWEMSAE